MCSSCISEATRQNRTRQIEMDFLWDMSPNTILAPLMVHRTSPTDLRNFRHLLNHLPTLNNYRRDDHIFGAVCYIANTLGFKLENSTASESIDPQLTELEIKQTWHMATFRCKCSDNHSNQCHFGPRTFCSNCTLPIYRKSLSTKFACPICDMNEAWQQPQRPCLACHFAAIIYPFQARFDKQIEFWCTAALSESSDSDQGGNISFGLSHSIPSPILCNDANMLYWRNKSIEKIPGDQSPSPAKPNANGVRKLIYCTKEYSRASSSNIMSAHHL
jgi:hypothetical protein